MVPLLRNHARAAAVASGNPGPTNKAVPRGNERDFPIAAMMTDRVPTGRKAIRAIISALPKLAETVESYGFSQEGAMEIISDLLERRIEDVCRPSGKESKSLAQAARWAGVGPLDISTARKVGSIIAANSAVVDQIVAAHMPPSLSAYTTSGCSRPVLGGDPASKPSSMTKP